MHHTSVVKSGNVMILRKDLNYRLWELKRPNTRLVQMQMAQCHFFKWGKRSGQSSCLCPCSLSVSSQTHRRSCEQWFPDVSYRWPLPCQINCIIERKEHTHTQKFTSKPKISAAGFKLQRVVSFSEALLCTHVCRSVCSGFLVSLSVLWWKDAKITRGQQQRMERWMDR